AAMVAQRRVVREVEVLAGDHVGPHDRAADVVDVEARTDSGASGELNPAEGFDHAARDPAGDRDGLAPGRGQAPAPPPEAIVEHSPGLRVSERPDHRSPPPGGRLIWTAGIAVAQQGGADGIESDEAR